MRKLLSTPEGTTPKNGIGFAIACIGVGIMTYAVSNEAVHIGAVLLIGVVAWSNCHRSLMT
jgi:hypothetical protein